MFEEQAKVLTLRRLGVFFLSVLLVGCGQSKETEQADAKSEPAETPAAESRELTERERALKVMGWSVGMDIFRQVPLEEGEVELIMEGIRDAAEGKPEPHDMAYMLPLARKMMQERLNEIDQRRSAAMNNMASDNLEKASAFLAELDGREGIQKTASGLRYEILQEGTDRFAAASDQVTVHYHGTLIDGRVFDSSLQRGQPVTFGLGNVIAGFKEGLQLVGETGKIKLYVPSDLGYGNRPPPGGLIQAGTLLIFEVEVIKVIPGG